MELFRRMRLSPLAMLVCVTSISISSQVSAIVVPPTGAGQLGNQLRQEAESVPQAPVVPSLSLPSDDRGQARAPADNTRVTVTQVHFTGDMTIPGARGIREETLQSLVTPWMNRSLSFTELQAMTEAVTQLYRERGVLLAQAILPPQTIKDGLLTVLIIPGKYDGGVLHNDSRLRDIQAVRMMNATAPAGTVVKNANLTRLALLMNEVPGVNAQVSLQPGLRPGTSAPTIILKPEKRVGGYVGGDNQGDPTTGRNRVMVGGYANGLLGYGDLLRVDLLDAYEKSNLFNGSLDYSLLVGGYGTRLGVNYSHLHYHYHFLHERYNGDADSWGLYVTHPWIRTARARVDVRASVGQQFLTDKYPSSLFMGLGEEGRKRVTLSTLTLSGSVAGVPGGVTGLNVQGTVGNLNYRNELSRRINFSGELGSSGQFARLNGGLSHDQQVGEAFSLYAGVNGQLANHNLDSSQKFLLGGPGAVRAYDIGTGSVDKGAVAIGEVRWKHRIPVSRWLGTAPMVTVAAFYDQGWGTQYVDNQNMMNGGELTPHNRVNLAGAGLYSTVADAGNYALTLTWAHRTGDADPVSGQADHHRFWISAVKSF